MSKEKFHIECVFNKGGKTSLWNYVSTPAGLSEWFADEVTADDNVFTFVWDNYPSKAELLAVSSGNFIRFRWLEDETSDTYFEFRIHKNELTGGLLLEIVDFATPEEKDDAIVLWENEIKILKRILGL